MPTSQEVCVVKLGATIASRQVSQLTSLSVEAVFIKQLQRFDRRSSGMGQGSLRRRRREAMKGYAADQIPANLQAYYTFEKMEADGTFLNYGKAGADKVGKIVVMKNSGGENTSKASYEQQQAFNDFLGYPGIVGSKEIKTTTEWTLANATIQSTGDVAVVSYLYGGSHKGSVTLGNEWEKPLKRWKER